MKNVIRILALLAIGACNHAPLKVGGVKDASTASVPSTQTASATATQTELATQTPTGTETSTSTATAPVTVTTVVTATTTATATATATGTVGASKKLGIRVNRADDTPASRDIYAGTSDNDATHLVFDADEPINVSQIPFMVVGNNPTADILSLRVYSSSGILVCSGALDKNNVLNCRKDPNLFVINGPTALTLKVTAGQLGSGTYAAKSGDWFDVGIHADASVDDQQFQGLGVNTGTVYATQDLAKGLPDPAIVLGGNIMTLRGCAVGTTADIGNGINPRIAGSATGFGVIWKDNSHMPKEMDKVMIASLDIGGNKWADAQDITATTDLTGITLSIVPSGSSYTVDSRTDLYSNFVRFGTDGQIVVSAYNQPITDLIAGTQNMYGFFNNGAMAPVLENFNLASTSLEMEKSYQWGPSQRSSFKTIAGAQGGSTWAFGMSQAGQAMIIVVQDDGVYPNVANPIDNATGGFTSLDGIVLDSIVATDIGYVMAWWYEAAGQNYNHYLSFVPFNGTSDGVVKQTIEVTGWTGSDSGARHDRLAWNGKYIGLLAANPVVGETDLLMFRNDGTQVGGPVSIFTKDAARKSYDAADLAASGSTFGIASTSSAGDKAQLTPVNCD